MKSLSELEYALMDCNESIRHCEQFKDSTAPSIPGADVSLVGTQGQRMTREIERLNAIKVKIERQIRRNEVLGRFYSPERLYRLRMAKMRQMKPQADYTWLIDMGYDVRLHQLELTEN
jgi:hypothetical protein